MIDFERGAILAPLTRVGNLPFRRLCKDYGADITVSEMAVARNLVRRRRSEMALLKHHACESPFGIQLCGRRADEVSEAAIIAEGMGADFIDLNLGCPIDAITRWGGGSALLRQRSRVAKLVRAMVAAVSVPVTVKIRLGWSDDRPTAVEIARTAAEEGAAAIMVHGRSRAQRYRKPANWEAIAEVASSVSVPVIGNGDLFHASEVAERRAASGTGAVMIARGALMKPWIFQEIREGRVLDPTSEERFEMLRRYVGHGLEHFGDDDHGRTRVWQFLRDQLDFLYRYAPVGALEKMGAPPQQLQERAPIFEARDELEALLASPDVADHERICEMLLGARPSGVIDQRPPEVTG